MKNNHGDNGNNGNNGNNRNGSNQKANRRHPARKPRHRNHAVLLKRLGFNSSNTINQVLPASRQPLNREKGVIMSTIKHRKPKTTDKYEIIGSLSSILNNNINEKERAARSGSQAKLRSISYRWSDNPRITGAVAVVLLIATLAIAVIPTSFRVRAEETNEEAAIPSPSPIIQIAKEYIYAGSRMLAIEDYGLAPPSTPVIANLDVRSSAQIDVYWTQAPAGENVASYNLRINGSNVISGITYLSKAITGLVANTSYTFEVQAVKASGATSSWSQPLSAATGAVVTTPMIAAVQPQSSTQLDIYWNQPPAGETVSSYNLRINSSQVVTGITYLSWAVRNLTPNTTYSLEVQAVNSANVTSAWSAPVSGTTAPPPNATTIGAVTTVSSSQLNIFWNASSSQSAASYNLRINGSQIITGISYLSYPVKNLSANTTYTFEVQAVDAAGGTSAWSPSVSGTTSQ